MPEVDLPLNIYGLKNPDTGLYIYVGSTWFPETRVYGHRAKRRGLLFEILEVTTTNGEAEYQWIDRLIREGHPLTNRLVTTPNRRCVFCGHQWWGWAKHYHVPCLKCFKQKNIWLPGPQMKLFL